MEEMKEALDTAYYGPAFYGSLWQLLDFEAEVRLFSRPRVDASACCRAFSTSPIPAHFSHPLFLRELTEFPCNRFATQGCLQSMTRTQPSPCSMSSAVANSWAMCVAECACSSVCANGLVCKSRSISLAPSLPRTLALALSLSRSNPAHLERTGRLVPLAECHTKSARGQQIFCAGS